MVYSLYSRTAVSILRPCFLLAHSSSSLSSLYLCHRNNSNRNNHSKQGRLVDVTNYYNNSYNNKAFHTTTTLTRNMTEEEEGSKTPEQLQDALDALNAKITSQGATVRTLKKEGGSADAIAEAVALLQNLKIEAAEINKTLEKDKVQFNRKAFDDLVLRKMFVVPSFEIHGGVKGLYDLGPPACALKVSSVAFG